MQVLNSKH